MTGLRDDDIGSRPPRPEKDVSAVTEDRFSALADAVADGADVDWAGIESQYTDADDRHRVEDFRVLAALGQLNRSPDCPAVATAQGSCPVDLKSWGPFHIRAEVGHGIFGTVYRAWDPKLEREVALKLLRNILVIDEDAMSVAINEGRLLAQIDHPNIVRVFGADRFDGSVGIWMQFVNGRTLKDIVKQHGPFGDQEAVIIGLDLCHALAAVHHAGFLHRDVKAQNVMRESGGRILLMDFGGAAVMRAGLESDARIRATPLYLAPEVLHGDPPSVRSDLYSLGVLLYFLVTGQFPVNGNSLDDLREAHSRHRRTLLRDLRPDLPSSFVRVIDDATAALPSQRPASAGVMEVLLESATGRGPTRRSGPAPAQSIAVLPFVDMSPGKNLEYFCDGIAEEIINILTRVSGVRVAARGSAFQFKDKTSDVRHIGSMLNVATVLEGSVRAAGDRLRITAQIVDAESGYQLWSRRFDKSLDDVFAVQDEIATASVSALGLQPSDPTPRGEAYALYLKGRHYWNQRTEAGLHKSVATFQAAIEKDSRYAEAHAGLAEAYATLGLYGAVSPQEVMPKAKAAAQDAIEILGTLSGPFVTAGCVAGVYDWAWSEAERLFQQALGLNPNHPHTHHWYAINYLVPMKRFEEARQKLRYAVDADPLSAPIRVSCGLLSYFARQYVEGLQELRNSLELDPGSATARLFIGLTLVETGDFDEAVRELQTAIRLSDSPEMTAALGYAFARAGNVDQARQALGKLFDLSGRRYISSSLIAQVHAGLGDTVLALEWLEKAGAERASDLAWLGVRPVFDGLRLQPRFANLLTRLGQRA
jgi:TolB-like protein/tetratricopeptide (TPR) repeat protein